MIIWRRAAGARGEPGAVCVCDRAGAGAPQTPLCQPLAAPARSRASPWASRRRQESPGFLSSDRKPASHLSEAEGRGGAPGGARPCPVPPLLLPPRGARPTPNTVTKENK